MVLARVVGVVQISITSSQTTEKNVKSVCLFFAVGVWSSSEKGSSILVRTSNMSSLVMGPGESVAVGCTGKPQSNEFQPT